MDITYLGHASFLIKTKEAKVVTDPFNPKIGLTFPKVTADIVTISHGHDDHNYRLGISGEPMIFDWPGEYEKKNVRIFGIQSYHDNNKGAERGDNVIFKFDIEGMSIVHLGDQGFVPDDHLIDEIGDVDILFLPTGGGFTINSSEAEQTVKKLDPSIVIPMHYAVDGLNEDLRSKMEPVQTFLQKMGMESAAPVDKLTLKREDLSEADLRVIVMKPTA